jgi:hypothetical protein
VTSSISTTLMDRLNTARIGLNASGFSPQSRSARGDDGKTILDLKVGSNSSRFGANDAKRRLSRLR